MCKYFQNKLKEDLPSADIFLFNFSILMIVLCLVYDLYNIATYEKKVISYIKFTKHTISINK